MRHALAFAILLALVPSIACAQRPLRGLPAGVTVHRDLAYVESGHERQKLDLYLPEKGEQPAPVVVWIHGGAWQAGDKRGGPAQFLLNNGYAVASINYRLSQHAPMPAQIHDCKAAVRWLRAKAKEHHLNGDCIGVWGASAGGHLVALLGTSGDVKELEGDLGHAEHSSRVQCVVDWFGPSDLTGIVRADPVAKLLGGTGEEQRKLAASGSPVTHVTKDDPPFLIMHGDQDRTVGLRQSELLADKLKAAEVEVELKVFQGAGHGGADFTSAESRTAITAFLDKHLKK